MSFPPACGRFSPQAAVAGLSGLAGAAILGPMTKVTVKHFRQIAVWPVQLMPVRRGQQVQRHWELLDAAGGSGAWRAANEAGAGGAGAPGPRHYKGIVTLLPSVARFLCCFAAAPRA